MLKDCFQNWGDIVDLSKQAPCLLGANLLVIKAMKGKNRRDDSECLWGTAFLSLSQGKFKATNIHWYLLSAGE